MSPAGLDGEYPRDQKNSTNKVKLENHKTSAALFLPSETTSIGYVEPVQ